MKKSLLTIFLALLSFATVSQAAYVAGDTASWQPLLQKIVLQGETFQSKNGEYRTLTMGQDLPSSIPHLVAYLSTVGAMDSDGIYQIDHLELVAEDWSLDADGNSKIDQWLFNINTDGTLSLSIHHYMIIEYPSGVVISDTLLPDTEEEKLLQLNQLLSQF